MKRITLTMMLVVAASTAVQSQDPTPPARPVPAPAQPAQPAPRVAPTPPMYLYPPARVEFDADAARQVREHALELGRVQRDLNMDIAREQREHALEMSRVQRDLSMDVARQSREQALEMSRIQRDVEMMAPRIASEETRRIAEMAREQSAMAREDARAQSELVRSFAEHTPMALPAPAFATTYTSDGFLRHTPPQAWAHSDPADSLYSLARDVLNRGDWGRAARMFAEVQKTYPNSVYKNEALYWEAHSRYKIGTTDELHRAAQILEPVAAKANPSGGQTVTLYSSNIRSKTSDADVVALYLRINGALAMRGDRNAAAIVEKAATTQGAPCDQEDITVRGEALNALSQIDPAAAIGILRRVIEKKDECSASLRRSAVFMLGRRSDAESAALLLTVAKNDPNMNVRTEAIRTLSRVSGDAGLNALEDMLRNEQDERIQRAAVQALMSSDSPRARSSMRALIDRKDAPMNLRIEAINSFNSERVTSDDAAYLRGLYNKAENDQMKGAIIDAVSRIGGSENDQWVLAIARNANEPSSLRSRAIGRFTRSTTIPISDVSKLYDAASESSEMRGRIINMLANRKEPEATDKLLEIARLSTSIDNRKAAMQALLNKKDPRTTQLLMDILDGKKAP